jgi:hypothetical protein
VSGRAGSEECRSTDLALPHDDDPPLRRLHVPMNPRPDRKVTRPGRISVDRPSAAGGKS